MFSIVCGDLGAVAACTGEHDHMHPLAEHPLEGAIPTLVNSRTGVPVSRPRQRYQARTHHQHL
jgi:hypothetical protein